MENYLDNIDLYEVDKQDYRSYEYRCKDRQTMKVRPREGVSVFKDIKTGEWLYGYEEENVMCMSARRFFIFYFLPNEELGPYLGIKQIQMNDEDYEKFLKMLMEKKQNGETVSEENG